jgi:drug/metabolite transporter (DMT)-like permease
MFAGLLSVWLLKRKQRSYHWLGMAICTTGVIVIGVCSVFQNSGKDGHGNGAAGMILILFGTFASAVRPSPHSCVLGSGNLISFALPGLAVMVWNQVQIVVEEKVSVPHIVTHTFLL